MSDQFWQDFEPAPASPLEIHVDRFPAPMPDGRVLLLPLRQPPADPHHAVASLIATQASFVVERALVGWLAEAVRVFAAEIVVGLPTLGLVVARPLAERLGHGNWVAAGYSRKFWYDEALSVPVSSITSPGQEKRLWLDPRMLPRLAGRRVLLVDDVISTGTSIVAALALLETAGVAPVGIAAAMLQTTRWQARLPADAPPVAGVFATPLFRRAAQGWTILPGTLPRAACPLLR